MESSKGRGLYLNHNAENIFDLAVIGAGPSGSLAAALAAESGLSTIVLERRKHPRPKICGGFLSARAISLLPGDLKLSSLRAAPVCRVSVVKKRQSWIYTSQNRLGLVIDRPELDQLLADYALSRGALLRENKPLLKIIPPETQEASGCHVLKCGNNPEALIKARFLIGADGALGNTARLAGLRKSGPGPVGWGLSMIRQADLQVTEPGRLEFYPLPFLGGMGWSFSGPGWTNCGVGGFSSRGLLGRAFRKLFPGAPLSPKPSSWPLPFLGPLQKPASGNVILIGDASGLVEPFSGEGLYNSFKSAIMAVHAVRLAIRGKSEAAPLYTAAFRKQFRKSYAAGRNGIFHLYIRSLFTPSTLPPLMAALMENRLRPGGRNSLSGMTDAVSPD